MADFKVNIYRIAYEVRDIVNEPRIDQGSKG